MRQTFVEPEKFTLASVGQKSVFKALGLTYYSGVIELSNLVGPFTLGTAIATVAATYLPFFAGKDIAPSTKAFIGAFAGVGMIVTGCFDNAHKFDQQEFLAKRPAPIEFVASALPELRP